MRVRCSLGSEWYCTKETTWNITFNPFTPKSDLSNVYKTTSSVLSEYKKTRRNRVVAKCFYPNKTCAACLLGISLNPFTPKSDLIDFTLSNVPVKSKLKHPPSPPLLSIPRTFDVFCCPVGREFGELSLPQGRAFDHYS